MAVYVAFRSAGASPSDVRKDLNLSNEELMEVLLPSGGTVLVPTSKDVEVQLSQNPHQKLVDLSRSNALLRAQVDDLQCKLQEVETFKQDVFETIKALKREVAELSADKAFSQ